MKTLSVEDRICCDNNNNNKKKMGKNTFIYIKKCEETKKKIK